MPRKFNYEVGDYVKFEGDLSTLENILRDPDFGRIEEFQMDHGVERVYLYLLGKKQHIWCDLQDIRQIFTEPEHLRTLGFQTIEVNGRKKYELDNVTISGAVITTPKTIYLLQYCIGDFTKGIPNISSYIENEELKLHLFFINYPDVTNLNDLLKYLESQGRYIDKEKVVCI